LDVLDAGREIVEDDDGESLTGDRVEAVKGSEQHAQVSSEIVDTTPRRTSARAGAAARR
jgi:hypothetical protein